MIVKAAAELRAAGINATVVSMPSFKIYDEQADDYKAKLGDSYSLEDFHETFIKLGPLPVPLIRKAMLGEIGNPF